MRSVFKGRTCVGGMLQNQRWWLSHHRFSKAAPLSKVSLSQVGARSIFLKCSMHFFFPTMSNRCHFTLSSASITWEKAEELKKEHCYVALDYMSELQIFKVRNFYLPFVFLPM